MNKSVRILHLRASNFVGGPERQILRYASFELGGDLQITLASFVGRQEGKELLATAKRMGISTLALPAGMRGAFKSVSSITQYIRQRGVLLLCTHGYRADLLGIWAAERCRVPVACFLRGWTKEDWKVRIYEALDRAFLWGATRIIALSETQAEQLRGHRYLAGKVRTVVNAIEIPALSKDDRRRSRLVLRQRLGLSADTPIVAASGRLSPDKGAAYFIRAIPAICGRFPAACFVLFGDGPLRGQLEGLAKELKMAEAVRFAGFVPEFTQLLTGVDILVNPSLSEQMPNVVLEAMATGVPVVATEVGGVGEIAGKDGAVYLIPPGDPDSLAWAVIGLLHDPVKRQQLGEAGQRRVREAFCPERQREQLHELYEELIPVFKSTHHGVHREHRERRGSQSTSASLENHVIPAKVGIQLVPDLDPRLRGGDGASDFHPFEWAEARDLSEKEPDALPTACCPLPASSNSSAPSVSSAVSSFVSIVVPVRNEEAHLGDLLQDLLAQDFPADRYEIIVVDGNSTDRTAKIVEEFAACARPRIVLLRNSKQLSSAGRNLGVRSTRGDIILFIDGHCRVSNSRLIRETVEIFDTTGADCLCRPQPLAIPENTWFQDVIAHARSTFIGHGLDSTIYATNLQGFADPVSSGAVYKRSVFERVGLYDEQFDACEDVEFNYRVQQAGLLSYLSPRLEVQYRPRTSLSGLFYQLFRYGRGRLRFVRKHAGAISASQLVPPAFVLWLVVAGVLSIPSRYAAMALAVTLGAYLGVLLLFSVALAFRYGWRHLFAAPAVYAAIHLGLGCGFWAEIYRHALGYSVPREVKGEETGS